MSRNPKLEAYLAARWELEQCEPADKASRLQTLGEITRECLDQHRGISPQELAALTGDAYREYSRTKREELLRKLARLR